MKRQFFLMLLIFSILSSTFTAFAQPKREFRAVWFQTVWAGDFPKTKGASNQIAEMQNKFNTLKNANINVVCFQVRSRCDAFYNSAYEPWSSDLGVSRGTYPGYDPLETAIDEAHARGMELHVWLNPYRYESTANAWGSNDVIRKNHPNWLLSYSDGMTILDPGNPEVIAYIANIVKDILGKYDVDGVLFDDYFYAYAGTPNALDQTTYNQYGNGKNRSDWRRENVNKMVEAVYNAIQSTKPWVRFGVSPFGIWTTDSSVAASYNLTLPSGISGNNTYESIYCNPVAWMQQGTVDYISPQIYWQTTSTNQNYNKLCQWWSNLAKTLTNRKTDGKKVHFYSSMSRSSATNSETNLEVECNRTYDVMGAPGHIFFNTTGFLKNNYDTEISNNFFNKKALPPAVDWKNHATLPAPTNLNVSGTSMTWKYKSSSAANSEARFAIYCFPKGTNATTAMENSTYLLGISYNPSFTLSSSYNSSNTYAVRTLDRYGNEFDAAYFNAYNPTTATTDNATNITKTSATLNGTTSATSGNVIEKGFEWRKTSATSYSTIAGTITGNSITANLTGLQKNTSYTYRVFVTTSEGKVYGNTKTFTTLNITAPTVTTTEVSNITKTSAQLNGTVVKGDENISASGFEWKTVGGNYTTKNGTLSGSKLTANLTGLTHSTNYIFRAFAKTSSGTYYGSEQLFSTVTVVAPTVTTNAVSNENGTSATLNGTVTAGSEPITKRGFRWKQKSAGSFTTTNSSSQNNNFSAQISGLSYNTTYQFKAFVTTESGTTEGSLQEFTTQPDPADLAGTILIKKLWETTTNIATSDNEQRSIAYYNGKLYIPRINEYGTCEVYDALTGNHDKQLFINYFDSKWNMMSVAISNDGQLLFGSSLIGSSRLVVNVSDINNGGLQKSEDVSMPSFGRCDYFSFYGDFNSSSTGYIFALSNTTSKVARIPVTNGNFGEPEYITGSAIPTGKSTKTLPISSTQFYTQTSDFVPRLNNTNGAQLQTFGNNVQCKNASGMTVFALKGRTFMAIPNDTLGSIRILEITNGLQNGTDVVSPTARLGNRENTAFTIGLCSREEAERAIVYVMVPNNALAAYEISIYKMPTECKTIESANYQLFNTREGIRIETENNAKVEIYDMRGVLISHQQIAGTTNIALNRGVYVVRIDNQVFKIVH